MAKHLAGETGLGWLEWFTKELFSQINSSRPQNWLDWLEALHTAGAPSCVLHCGYDTVGESTMMKPEAETCLYVWLYLCILVELHVYVFTHLDFSVKLWGHLSELYVLTWQNHHKTWIQHSTHSTEAVPRFKVQWRGRNKVRRNERRHNKNRK